MITGRHGIRVRPYLERSSCADIRHGLPFSLRWSSHGGAFRGNGGPCCGTLRAKLRRPCQQAGFARGGAKAGNGIQVDCVRPIMQGTAQRSRASKQGQP